MKKALFTLILFVGFLNIGNAQIINFPDSNFKTLLLNASTSNSIATNEGHFPIAIDTNEDGEIQISEALQVYQLWIVEANISDLTGIEYFTNLKNLNCSYNQLTNLDILNTMPNLVTLTCNNNQLTSLNTSSLNTLTELRCNNNDLASTNLILNNNLILLDCSNNPLGTLEVSTLTDLEILICSSNLLSNLDVTNLTNLHTLNCSSNSLTSLSVNTLTNLNRLDFSENSISTIDLSALVNLEYLICSQNGLTALNVSSSPGLIELICHFNEISSLDVSALISLEKLQINNNSLTEIDLNTLTNLKHLLCSLNLFSDLDVSTLINLEHLSYGNEGLATVNLVNQTNLESLVVHHIGELPTNIENLQNLLSLMIFMSEIEEIDVSNLSSLKEFTSHTNEFLTYVNLKNGNDFSGNGISFSNNPNLMFVCVNDNDLNNVYDLNNNGDFFVSSYCTFVPGGDYNIITGSVLWNCDETDTIVYTKVGIYDGLEEGAAFTDQNGQYTFFTQAGTYIIMPDIENPTFFSLTPPIDAVIFADNNNNEEIVDFCISANGINQDLEVIIAPLVPARPGFEATYKIVYRNKGNQVLSQDYGVSFVYNQHLMTYVSASITPDTQGPGGMNWSYENLLPFESREIVVTMLINTPTHPEYPVNIDDELIFTSIISPQGGDENVQDNIYILNQIVVGSFDPNDITCIEGEVVAPEYIGEELHYVIRFENTGTFYAENVVVAMEIDITKYDIDSVKLLNTSHNATSRIKNNKLEVFFNQIMLDSGGHGNILLAMKSINTLSEGDSVQSKADIYFDYNYPIITNDAVTVFEASMSVDDNPKAIELKFYPNPTTDYFNITSKSMIQSAELYDVSGRLIRTNLINDFETQQNVTNLTNGVYILKIKTQEGEVTGKIVKK